MIYLNEIMLSDAGAALVDGAKTVIEWLGVFTFPLTILSFLAFPFFWGYDDGRMKKDKTEAHWPKWFIYGSLIPIGANALDVNLFLTWALIYKPLFDIGWSWGAGYKYIHIGTTSVFDRIIHWLGLVKLAKNKFPIFVILYGLAIFVGTGLLIHLLR